MLLMGFVMPAARVTRSISCKSLEVSRYRPVTPTSAVVIVDDVHELRPSASVVLRTWAINAVRMRPNEN
jgi:hypothetical protein